MNVNDIKSLGKVVNIFYSVRCNATIMSCVYIEFKIFYVLLNLHYLFAFFNNTIYKYETIF